VVDGVVRRPRWQPGWMAAVWVWGGEVQQAETVITAWVGSVRGGGVGWFSSRRRSWVVQFEERRRGAADVHGQRCAVWFGGFMSAGSYPYRVAVGLDWGEPRVWFAAYSWGLDWVGSVRLRTTQQAKSSVCGHGREREGWELK
jgi:hypothetical protein